MKQLFREMQSCPGGKTYLNRRSKWQVAGLSLNSKEMAAHIDQIPVIKI